MALHMNILAISSKQYQFINKAASFSIFLPPFHNLFFPSFSKSLPQ